MFKSMGKKLITISCADPESFVRGGPNTDTFLLEGGGLMGWREDRNATENEHSPAR